MLIAPALAILFLLHPPGAQTTSAACHCSLLSPSGLRVNCSSRDLTELPAVPSGTTELHLQDNQLHSVRPGLLDALHGLRMVNLSGNPWNCECSILYLRAWLQDHGAVAGRPTCRSPASLAHRAIAELKETDFPSCQKSCAIGWPDILTFLLMTVLIALLAWCLLTVNNSTFTVGQRHMGMDKDLPRSFKAKHKRRSLRKKSKEAAESTPL